LYCEVAYYPALSSCRYLRSMWRWEHQSPHSHESWAAGHGLSYSSDSTKSPSSWWVQAHLGSWRTCRYMFIYALLLCMVVQDVPLTVSEHSSSHAGFLDELPCSERL